MVRRTIYRGGSKGDEQGVPIGAPLRWPAAFNKSSILEKKKHETRLKSFLNGAPLHMLDPPLFYDPSFVHISSHQSW